MIIGSSESKLDSSILNSEVDIMGYDIVRMDHSKRGTRVACYIKKSLSFNHKSSFCPNIEIIFIDISFPKSKPILVGVLYQPPDKPRFIEYLEYSLKESIISNINNISNIQECYLMGDFNVNLLSGNKMLLDKQYCDSYTQAPPLIKKYMDIYFSYSLHLLITESTLQSR